MLWCWQHPLVVMLVLELFGTFTDLVGGICQDTKSVSYIAVMPQPKAPAGTTADPLAVLTAALKLLMPNQPATNLKTPTFEWTISDQYDEFKLFLRVHGELIPSSGNTRWTRQQRYPPGIHPEFPQYHWPLEMEPKDTCWCDHRWYCSYEEECKILPGSLSITHGPHCVSKMSNIPIGRCRNQAWRDPRWTGRSSESPCW